MVEFINTTKKYETVVLDDLTFKINEYDYVALIGNNGCGKTTTMNVMCNIVPYENGKVFMFGRKVDSDYVSYKNKLGVVLSEPYYIEDFTPYEYLKFVGKFQKIPKKEIRKRIVDIVSFLEIENFERKKISEYSSGNQMKISLSAALIHNPELLILDEPFVNLDIQTTETLIKLLKSFKGKKTLFISSHDLDLVANLCDRFLIMDKGKIAVDIHMDNFDNIGDVKEHIKQLLVHGEDKGNELEWLK